MRNLLRNLSLVILIVGVNNLANAKPIQEQQQSHARRIEFPSWPAPIQGNCIINNLGMDAKKVKPTTFLSIKEKGYIYDPSNKDGLNLSLGCQTSSTNTNNQLYIMDFGNCALSIEDNNYTVYVGSIVIKNAYSLGQNVIGNKLLLALPKCVQ